MSNYLNTIKRIKLLLESDIITIGKLDLENEKIVFFDKEECEVAYTSLLVQKTNITIVLKRTIADQSFACLISTSNHKITIEKSPDINLGLEFISLDEILAS